MAKFIKILIGVVVVIAGVIIWIKNPGDIQSRALQAETQAKRKASEVLKTKAVTPHSRAQAKLCRDMLRRIQNAKRAAEQRKGLVGVNVTWKDVLPYLKMTEIPRCPSGGTYNLNPTVQSPSCTIGGNGTIETTDDHSVVFK
jgi:hypothetical protein